MLTVNYGILLDNAPSALEVQAGGEARDTRDCCVIDTLENCFFGPFNVLRKNGLEANHDPAAAKKVIRAMLYFLFEKKLMVPRKTGQAQGWWCASARWSKNKTDVATQ